MQLSLADRVWNRAALESGGRESKAGDRALAALLLAHGLVMNGGVHHALETLSEGELEAAADGYAFFGCDDVCRFLRGASEDPVLCQWTEATEPIANARYSQMVLDDAYLSRAFERVFAERPGDFAAVDGGQGPV